MFYTRRFSLRLSFRALFLGLLLGVTPQISWARSLVLVDGILGDFVQTTFNGIEEYWNRQGSGRAYLIRPSSFESWENNSSQTLSEIRGLLAAHPEEEFIVFAHSRGAAELMFGLLRDPEVLKIPRLKQVVLVQGAYWGSPLADWVAEQVDSRVDWLSSFRPALKALTTREARIRMNSALASCSEQDRGLFEEKVAFIRAKQSFSGTRAALKAGHIYLSLFSEGDTDGVLLTDQQKIPGFGKDWGVLEGDHFEWVERGAKSLTLLENVLLRL